MKNNSVLRILLLLVVSSINAQSVCEEQPVNNSEISGTIIGQSIFMNDCNGFFSSIELIRMDDGAELTTELKILNGQTFLGTPHYVQTVVIPQTTGPFIINFEGGAGDLSFFEDSQYTIILSSPTLILGASSDIDSYVDGQMFMDVGFINNDDLWFKLSTSSTLGMGSSELKKRSVFPNPVNEYFQISGIIGKENFAIYNNLGIKVMNGTVSKDEEVNIQNLTAGLYFLKFNDGKIFKVLKK